MLQLNIQTSSSEMIPISDFQYIYDLAKCSKCNTFVLLRSTNKLYGASDDCCCIHEIDVPFLVNTDLIFTIGGPETKDLIFSNKNFFIPDMFPNYIVPEYYWEMYINGDIYEYEGLLIDKTTKQPISVFPTPNARNFNEFRSMEIVKQLEGLLFRFSTLSLPETFTGIENDENIRTVFDNKVAMGRVLCTMRNDRVNVAFYFHKSMFSLAKADALDLDIRFDVFDTNLFMATFKPKKKKNPLTFNTYGVSFQEKIHCMYINLA